MRNRLHVLPNDLKVSGAHVANVRSDREHPAGVAERKVGFVPEADTEVQCSVRDGMVDKVHHLAVNLWVPFPQLLMPLLDSLLDLALFLGADRGYRRVPNHHYLRFPSLFQQSPPAARMNGKAILKSLQKIGRDGIKEIKLSAFADSSKQETDSPDASIAAKAPGVATS
jgi:hypothetical protein